MTDVAFGELEEILPRLAWANEARNFTPWLAANLGRLGKAIGIDLELVQAEMAVGRYAADILARSAVDQSMVLIENQLEYSDHSHLGQILTYLTGLKAETIVWVAPAFREEHLSAVRWLNENTKEPFSFFAVKVKVVRIGTSPLAPLFEVLESPNDWDRRIEQVAQSSREIGTATLRRRQFWTRYAERFPDVAADVGKGGTPSIWHAVPGTELVLSQWLSNENVGIFVRGGRGVPMSLVIDRLLPCKDTLEAALGAKLDDPQFPLISRREGDVESEADFEAQANWLHDRLLLYKAELTKVLRVET